MMRIGSIVRGSVCLLEAAARSAPLALFRPPSLAIRAISPVGQRRLHPLFVLPLLLRCRFDTSGLELPGGITDGPTISHDARGLPDNTTPRPDGAVTPPDQSTPDLTSRDTVQKPDIGPDSRPDSGPEIPPDLGPDLGPDAPPPTCEVAVTPIEPPEGAVFAPVRTYLRVTGGEAASLFRVCHTRRGGDEIDDPNECPNPQLVSSNRAVIDRLVPNATYLWKIQACCDLGGLLCAGFGEIRSFSTDDSVRLWLRLDEGVTEGRIEDEGCATSGTFVSDSSGYGNNAELVNSPCWVSEGLGGSGLSLNEGGSAEDFLEIIDSDSIDSPQAVELRFKPSPSGRYSLLDKLDAAITETPGYFLFLNTFVGEPPLSDPISWSINSTMGASFPVTMEPDWTFLALSSQAGAYLLFLNGETVLDETAEVAIPRPNDMDLRIGVNVTADILYEYASSIFDEVILYATPQTLERLRNNYCAIETLAGTTPAPSLCVATP